MKKIFSYILQFQGLLNVKKKKKNAVGTDSIPNEMLKSHPVMLFIYHLFTYCFNNGVVESTM